MTMTEPTPDQILAALKGAGLDVYQMPGWRGRCRCHAGSHETKTKPTGRAWYGPKGITWHHTAGPMLSGQAAIYYTARILVAGNGAVPGPLCMGGIDADGRILLVSAGRANHIGYISQKAASAITNATWPTSGYTDWRGAGVDGNAFTYGWEILAPMTPNGKQIDAAVRATAALNKLCGLSARSTHGHGEASNQRSYVDPNLDMGAIRRRVGASMSATVTSSVSKPATVKGAAKKPELGKGRPFSIAAATASMLTGNPASHLRIIRSWIGSTSTSKTWDATDKAAWKRRVPIQQRPTPATLRVAAKQFGWRPTL